MGVTFATLTRSSAMRFRLVESPNRRPSISWTLWNANVFEVLAAAVLGRRRRS
jgi:hypothetical protein